uniref:Uncharacterized protein n=1 Tax=Oryza meridionalis TaxID=40149 RepID=A0A0E0DAW7_9ORYZ
MVEHGVEPDSYMFPFIFIKACAQLGTLQEGRHVRIVHVFLSSIASNTTATFSMPWGPRYAHAKSTLTMELSSGLHPLHTMALNDSTHSAQRPTLVYSTRSAL